MARVPLSALVLTHQNEFSMWIGLICLLIISEALL